MYARATVVVVPVVESPFPFGITTLLEAMSMGKAVIVSGTEGLRGLVNDGETGLVVAPGDPAALRTAVVDLLADPEKRRRLGQAARRTAVEQYGLDLYVDRLAHHLGLVGASLAGEPTP
jgi:glycosyltransferase involved in cell wall biosynthesis